MTAQPRRFMQAHDAVAARRKADRELLVQAIAFVLSIVAVVAIASLS